ncbi:MAG: hypothetical protein MI864_23740 [Pseudomonadales bacterium]|nr:hypothetical protein [Pseudomonadales bacterium]
MEVEIFESNSQYQIYPEKEAVLGGRIEEDYLLPLGLLNWSCDETGDSFEILIAAPMCDEEGLIAARRSTLKDQSCSHYWLVYSNDDGKWYLESNRESFSVQNPDEYFHFQKTRQSFEEKKVFYQANGFLQCLQNSLPKPEYKSSIFNVGGIPYKGSNWFYQVCNELDHEYDYLEDSNGVGHQSVILLDEDGNEFSYIGSVAAYTYTTELTGTLLYFFEPENQRALVVVEYT